MRLRGQFGESQARRIYGALATGLIFYLMLQEAVEEMNRRFGTRLHAVPVETSSSAKASPLRASFRASIF